MNVCGSAVKHNFYTLLVKATTFLKRYLDKIFWEKLLFFFNDFILNIISVIVFLLDVPALDLNGTSNIPRLLELLLFSTWIQKHAPRCDTVGVFFFFLLLI